MLSGKVIYVVTTGARRSKEVNIFLNALTSYGARGIWMPTPMSLEIVGENFDAERMKKDFTLGSSEKRIPEEDMVVVAPCTFNTLSKIALGIADNYPLSIIHSAIGMKKPVIIAPSINEGYFNHPLTQQYIDLVSSWKNVSVVYPEKVYGENGELERITMAPWEKIIDGVCHRYTKIRYEDAHSDRDITPIVERHFSEFYETGKFLLDSNFTRNEAGFLAMRIAEGILVTSTGSAVGALKKEDLTLITSWEGHKVIWAGKARPSSETPLVLEIFEEYPEISVVVHGHCTSITYSPKMVRYNSQKYLSYGAWGELDKINALLKKYQMGIMKLHGELIIAGSFAEAKDLYKKLDAMK